MVNDMIKPVGPPADYGTQRVQPAARATGTDPTGNTQDSATAKAAGSPQGAPAVGREEATKLAEDLTQLVQTVNRQLSFKVDEHTGNTVIQVIDSDSKEVLRQIPPDDIVNLQKRLAELQESGTPADTHAVGGMLFQSQV
jgi:flagellar protein FlaG